VNETKRGEVALGCSAGRPEAQVAQPAMSATDRHAVLESVTLRCFILKQLKKHKKNYVIANPKNFRCIEKTIKNLIGKIQSVARLR
jgi:hypothetical protein